MGNNGGLVVFLFMIIVVVVGGFALFFTQFQPPKEKTVTCKNEWSTISFLINEEENILIMNGELVAPESIKIFNSTAISAQWKHAGATTKFFLDRIAGALEVETTEDSLEWDKNKFECNFSQKRF
tara:strand:- start:42306 stop:42680 length:375 start_codon:yes stop_codon:yes gene_type:complete